MDVKIENGRKNRKNEIYYKKDKEIRKFLRKIYIYLKNYLLTYLSLFLIVIDIFFK